MAKGEKDHTHHREDHHHGEKHGKPHAHREEHHDRKKKAEPQKVAEQHPVVEEQGYSAVGQKTFDGIADVASPVVSTVKNAAYTALGAAVVEVPKAHAVAVENVVAAAEAVRDTATPYINNAKNNLDNFANTVAGMPKVIGDGVDATKDAAVAMAYNAKNSAVNAANTTIQTGADLHEKAVAGTVAVAEAATPYVNNAINNAKNNLDNFANTVAGMPKVIGDGVDATKDAAVAMADNAGKAAVNATNATIKAGEELAHNAGEAADRAKAGMKVAWNELLESAASGIKGLKVEDAPALARDGATPPVAQAPGKMTVIKAGM